MLPPCQAFADTKFKGLRTWKAVHTALRAAGTRSLAPAAAAAATAARPGLFSAFGAPASVILDVREPLTFAGGHATGALNVPLYAPLVRAKRCGLRLCLAWCSAGAHTLLPCAGEGAGYV
jgi:hypothetical protein